MFEEKNNILLDLFHAGVDEMLDNKPFYKQKPASFTPVLKKAVPTTSPKKEKPSFDLTSIDSLEDLKEALLAYEGCPFKKTAKNLVFGEGNIQADVMLIGEAPGADEDRQGRPFIGRSGKLLEAMMNAAGFTRDHFYITNALYWRPPANRQPTPEDVASCAAFLEKHIQLINPKIILSLGSVSTKSLTGVQTGITRMRGRFYALENDSKKLVLPTFHPANLLRTPLNKRFVWRDILTLKQKLTELT